MESKGEQFIYFDNECNLCHFSKDFYEKRDKSGASVFLPLDKYPDKELSGSASPVQKLSPGVILFQNGKFYHKSDAVLMLIKQLPRWKFLYFLIYIPKPLRDFIYDLVAKYRYRVFGKKQVPKLNKG